MTKLRHFYATCAIGLGIWEASAFLTRKRIWTVTGTVRYAATKNDKVTRLVVTLWMLGLFHHFFHERFED